MAKIPPFVENPSTSRCGQASQAMIMCHFGYAAEAGEELFKWLDKINHHRPDKWTWSFNSVSALARLGLTVRTYDPINLERFVHDNSEYMTESFGEIAAAKYHEKLDMADIIDQAARLAVDPLVIKEPASHMKEDLYGLLAEGHLLICWVDNQYLLNGVKNKMAGHYVMAYQSDGAEITFHNPGGVWRGEPVSWRSSQTSLDHFFEAMRYPTGFFGECISFKRP